LKKQQLVEAFCRGTGLGLTTTDIKVALRLAGMPIGSDDTAIAGHTTSVDYNNERTHQGKMCCGRTPMATLLDGKRVRAEKNLNQI